MSARFAGAEKWEEEECIEQTLPCLVCASLLLPGREREREYKERFFGERKREYGVVAGGRIFCARERDERKREGGVYDMLICRVAEW